MWHSLKEEKNHREDQKEMIEVLSVFVLDQPDFLVVVLQGKGMGVYQRGHMVGTAIS